MKTIVMHVVGTFPDDQVDDAVNGLKEEILGYLYNPNIDDVWITIDGGKIELVDE